MLEKNEKGAPYDCPDELRIIWQGMEFYPVSLTISFDKNGNVINHCQFHDMKADSTAGADLNQINRKGGDIGGK